MFDSQRFGCKIPMKRPSMKEAGSRRRVRHSNPLIFVSPATYIVKLTVTVTGTVTPKTHCVTAERNTKEHGIGFNSRTIRFRDSPTVVEYSSGKVGTSPLASSGCMLSKSYD
eukprot:3514476-Pyramimonas_sp.AAC.3